MTFLKNIKVDEECYTNLTIFLGKLIAERGRLLTFDDALRELFNTRIVLPREMLREVEKQTERKQFES